MKHRPRIVTVTRSASVLDIEWDDGHRSSYRFQDLRSSCPCAQCNASHGEAVRVEAPGLLEIPLVDVNTLALIDVKPVGNYALQLFWKDGHSFGIYSWDYLRGLCPCEDHKG